MRRWGAWWLRALALSSEYGWMVREAEEEAARSAAAWETWLWGYLAEPPAHDPYSKGWELGGGVEILRMEFGFATAAVSPRALAGLPELPVSWTETRALEMSAAWRVAWARALSLAAIGSFWYRPTWGALWGAMKYAFLAEWWEHSR